VFAGSGRYSSAGEVIRAALRLIEDHQPEQAARFEQLNADVQKGIDQPDAGQSAELTDEVIEEIKARGRVGLAGRRGKSRGGWGHTKLA
jgi:putative addiction module CopG family antidote